MNTLKQSRIAYMMWNCRGRDKNVSQRICVLFKQRCCWYDTNQFYHFPTWPHRHWHWPVYPWQWPDPDTVATTGDLTHTTASRMVTFNTYHKGESAKIWETFYFLFCLYWLNPHSNAFLHIFDWKRGFSRSPFTSITTPWLPYHPDTIVQLLLDYFLYQGQRWIHGRGWGGIVPEDYLRYFSNKILDIFETWSQRNLSYNVVKLLLWRGM